MTLSNGQRKTTPYTKDAGVAGYRISSGYVYEEFLPDLRGLKGRRKLREMIDNDAIVGGVLRAINNILRSVDWHIDLEGNKDSEKVEWLKSALFKMPEMTWDDVVSEALSMLGFGFSILEIVMYKCSDGTFKPSKLAPRSQETIWRWDADNNGNIHGVFQDPFDGVNDIYIQAQKFLHFRTEYNRGNPEGRSLLRNAYRSYYYVKTLQRIEATAVERELNGVPVMRVPGEMIGDSAKLAEFQRIVRDLKFNEQGGVVLPSETYYDVDGKPTNIRQYEIELIASNGTRNIDVGAVIKRHQTDMARTMLADFMMLGDGAGSYALSQDKSTMFVHAIQAILEVIQQEINRKLIPMLWAMNGFPEDEMPMLRYGSIAPENITELGDYVSKLAGAGIILSDEETENHLRRAAGLPEALTDDLEAVS